VDPGSFHTVIAGRRSSRPLRERTRVLAAAGKSSGLGSRRVLAVGDASLAPPPSGKATEPVLPVRRGRLAHPLPMHTLLRVLLRRAGARSLLARLTGARVAMVLDPHLSAAERSEFVELGQEVAPATALPVDAAFAAAKGLGLDVSGNRAHMILDVGAGKTYAAILSWGGIVSLSWAEFGGQDLDAALQRFIEERHHIRISLDEAEALKVAVGSVFPRKAHGAYPLGGRDERTGFEKKVLLDDNDLRDVLADACEPLFSTVQNCLTGMPPELSGDIEAGGVTLVGGGALIYGLPDFLAERLGLRFLLAPDPLNTTIRGAQALLRAARAN